jgi:hypothetical protein
MADNDRVKPVCGNLVNCGRIPKLLQCGSPPVHWYVRTSNGWTRVRITCEIHRVDLPGWTDLSREEYEVAQIMLG